MRETLGLAFESDGHRAEGAFVMLVGPRATRGLALALQSLAVNVLAFHPRPVLLFYGAESPSALRPQSQLSASALQQHWATVYWYHV